MRGKGGVCTHTHVLGSEGWENEVGGKSQSVYTYVHSYSTLAIRLFFCHMYCHAM